MVIISRRTEADIKTGALTDIIISNNQQKKSLCLKDIEIFVIFILIYNPETGSDSYCRATDNRSVYYRQTEVLNFFRVFSSFYRMLWRLSTGYFIGNSMRSDTRFWMCFSIEASLLSGKLRYGCLLNLKPINLRSSFNCFFPITSLQTVSKLKP